MKVLVFGGTRFLGKRLVGLLAGNGDKVTVISRHPENCPRGAEVIGAERQKGIKLLRNKKFDLVLDFIAYDSQGPKQVFREILFDGYILISSAWMARLGTDILADEEVKIEDADLIDKLPQDVKNYIFRKWEAEKAALSRWRRSRDVTILRLPIMWGEGDHSRRMEFYARRILDGKPLILVNGGKNLAQIVWVDDAALAINKWIQAGFYLKRKIWEGFADEGTSVKAIVSNIANGLSKKLSTVDIPSGLLEKIYPAYLTREPLWRLSGNKITLGNIFNYVDFRPTEQAKWIGTVARKLKEEMNLR